MPEQDTDIIQDLSVEGIVIGSLINKPELFNEYLELINAEYDFSDPSLKFLYKLLMTTYLNNTTINETAFNIEASKRPKEEQDIYKALGGYKAYQRLANVALVQSDFPKIYQKLKTYNLLRELDTKGFNVRKYLPKLIDKTPDQVLKIYEMSLAKVGSYIKGINDSIRLGEDIEDVYESFKIKPDVGIMTPFPIVDTYSRGWRQGKLFASAMHSGFGKSRKALYMVAHTSVIGQTPVLFSVNEQEKSEIDLMLLTCISNAIFAPKYGITINESEIALGQCTGVKDEIVKDAARYIKERSKIQFLELNTWDFESLKIVLKKHKLRGVNFAVIDTFKAMRGIQTQGMTDWMLFAYTAERLKKIIGSEKQGGLNMGLYLTMQMTDESLVTKTLGSSAIATSKQTKHFFDYLEMSRMLDWKDKENIKVKLQIKGNPFNGQIQSLDPYKTYYMTFIDKNRSGLDKVNIIYEVQKGEMIFKELGFAVFNHQEKSKQD